jgi:sugar phosphate isomerase/epimerase
MGNEYNKIGIFNWFGYVMPAKERVKMIKEVGFDSIMLWWDEELFSSEGEKELLEIISMDIIIENLHVPYEECNLLWSEDKQKRNYIVNKHIEWIHDCDKYNIPMIVMHLTKHDIIKKPNKYGIESMKAIVEEGKKYNIKIAIENTRRDIIIDEVLDNIHSQWLGVCYDSSHANLYSDNLTSVLDKHGDRVMALHLSDNDGIADRHWLPNEGLIDWDKIINKLALIKYSGYISLEVFPDRNINKYSKEMFLQKAYAQAVNIQKKLMKQTK